MHSQLISIHSFWRYVLFIRFWLFVIDTLLANWAKIADIQSIDGLLFLQRTMRRTLLLLQSKTIFDLNFSVNSKRIFKGQCVKSHKCVYGNKIYIQSERKSTHGPKKFRNPMSTTRFFMGFVSFGFLFVPFWTKLIFNSSISNNKYKQTSKKNKVYLHFQSFP